MGFIKPIEQYLFCNLLTKMHVFMYLKDIIRGREEMTKNIIIKTSVQKRFDSFMMHGRVLFFSAPCGFGKTVLADALLHGQNVLRQSAADPGCAIPPSEQDWDILLIDDLQLMQEEAGQQALCELIRSSPEHRFVLLSRGVPPGCLTAFQYTGLMTVLEADDLLFDEGDVRRLFQLSGVNVTDSEINGILKESVGYPLGVAITARCMSPDKPWTPELVARVFHEVFLYFETAIYRRFDLPVRRFLLELAPFESFDLEMARMVSGDPRAGERLDWIFRYTTMLRYDDCQRFHFWSGFRAFLLWEMEREYTEEKRKALISRGGLYYELKEDYAHALECYTSGGDHSKVSELLVRNAELHPGMGHYAEMEKYYRSLPEAEILASPPSDAGHEHALCAGHGLRRIGALVWRTAKVCRTLRQAGRRRKAGVRPPCMAGHLSAPAGRERTDGNHPHCVPATDEQRGGTAVLFRHERVAEHHERRQGLFRMEQKGRPALQNPPSPCGGGIGAGRRVSCRLRHCREQI